MAERFIDLRSDTVTLPTPAMKAFIANAELGDDVFGEDPTVAKLEQKVAELLGKESAMLVPSGTMSNQIALRIHTQPGDEVLCESSAHIYLYEGGGPAMLSGLTLRLTPAKKAGVLDVEDFEGKVQPDNVHFPRTRLVCLENTHNRGGGSIYPFANIQRISKWARANGLAMHLDGARLMNAVVATGIPARQWAECFDTVSLCFSKGLGAPIGSALAGPEKLIRQARRVRKVFGGGMRQAGLVAAGCLFALENHVDRLAEDHANAQILAKVIESTDGLLLNASDVQTNLMWIPLAESVGPADELARRFREQNILVIVGGPRLIRICTHLGVSRADVERVAEVIPRVVRSEKSLVA